MRTTYYSIAMLVGAVLCGALYSGVAAAEIWEADSSTVSSEVSSAPQVQLARNPHHEEKHQRKHYEPEDHSRPRRHETEEYDRPGRSDDRRARSVVCRSRNYDYNDCSLNRRGRDVRLVRQLSDTRCRRGDNWGTNRNGVWVDRGCSGKFEVE